MFKSYIALSTVIVIMLAGTVGRVGYIVFSGSYTASQGYNSYGVTVDVDEPQLYYRNGAKINNNISELTAVIRPVTGDLAALNRVYSPKQVRSITNELSKGYPAVHTISSKNTALKTFETNRTDTSLKQFVSRDTSGFLKHTKEDYKRELKVSYHIDAHGRLLAGDEGTLSSDNYYSREGYVMTFDKRIQELTLSASKTISKGCVLVFDVNNLQLLACVTKPNDTYFNKAVEQYSVGSVFKIVLAACAIENNADISYYCNGSIKVGDTSFSCQNHRAHGFETLESALANSCNCYFANLALELGAEKIIDTAKRLGFDSHISLCDNWQFRASYLPARVKLKSQGELALFGFGQGKLTSSPLQLGATLCTVANGGKYRPPTVVISKKERNGSMTELPQATESRALSSQSAALLRSYLRTTVVYGTAFNAETNAHQSAGKTGTAQTGQYKNGRELCNAWFAGFYPYENPKYCIVILCEEGRSGSEDCCPVFRTIVENIE